MQNKPWNSLVEQSNTKQEEWIIRSIVLILSTLSDGDCSTRTPPPSSSTTHTTTPPSSPDPHCSPVSIEKKEIIT
jgi:hypothetical protein